MNVDLELYRVFCEVVKYKNISKAAESMYISQSAVTQSIQKLETILGGKVFYRNKTGVELTEEGKNLYEYVKNSIETMNNAENIFSKYITLEKGKVRIGGNNSLITSLIVSPLLDFIKKYPDIEIYVTTGSTSELMQKLVNGELDLVVLSLPYLGKKYADIEVIPLKKSNYSIFASKNYIKKHPVKNIKELSKHNLILPKPTSARNKIFIEYCKENNLELIAKHEISSSALVKEMVLNDIGIGFAETDSLSDIMNDIEIVEKVQIESMQEGIATLKKNMVNKATSELVKEIKTYYNISATNNKHK